MRTYVGQVVGNSILENKTFRRSAQVLEDWFAVQWRYNQKQVFSMQLAQSQVVLDHIIIIHWISKYFPEHAHQEL